jgi:hypothetical protein
MIITDDFDSYNPSDDEILAQEEDESTTWIDDEEDFSYAATDDRYEGNGVPSWSAWA